MPHLEATTNLSAATADPRFVAAFEEISDRTRRGEAVDFERYARELPEHAAELRQLAETLRAVADLGAPDQDVPGPPQYKELGEFRILRELGRGGMGIVYEARQGTLDRRVALKVLHLVGLLDERQLKRFQNEARAAATLHHPHIVPVFSIGSERGVHYYAMQLIEGPSLAEVIEALRESRDESQESRAGRVGPAVPAGTETESPSGQQPRANSQEPAHSAIDTHALAALSTQRSESPKEYYRTVARWGVQAAEALCYAHENGVLHRDIKPANLLVDKSGDVWITDFGLARLESGASLTTSGDFLGTLRYMSPEQALGKRVLVDHRSDIYSLGVTLYELLTLRPALAGEDRQELLRQIAFEEPKAPRQINANIPRDLETILLKAIAKDAQARYTSAQELADDLQRFTETRPIVARRQSRFSKTAHWARRNRNVAALGGVLLLLLLALAVGGPIVAIQQARLTGRLEQVTDQQQFGLYARDLQLAHRFVHEGNRVEAQRVLLQWISETRVADLRGFEWFHLWQRCAEPAIVRSYFHDLPVRQARLIAGGRELAVSGFTPDLAIWDLNDEQSATPRLRIGTPTHQVDALLSLSSRGTLVSGDKDGNVTLIDPLSGEIEQTVRLRSATHDIDINSLSVSPDERLLAIETGDRQQGIVYVWNIDDWKEEHALTMPSISQAVFSSTEQLVVLQKYPPTLSVVDLATGDTVKSIALDASSGAVIAMNADQSAFAIALRDEAGADPQYRIELWEAIDWKRSWSHSTDSDVRVVTFSPDGRYLAFGDGNGNARIADLAGKTPTVTMRRKLHHGILYGIDFSADGKQLVTCGADGYATIWEMDQLARPLDCIVNKHDGALPLIHSGGFLDQDGTLAITSVGGTQVDIWDASTGQVKDTVSIQTEGNVIHISVAPANGRCCMVASAWPPPTNRDPTSRILVWDLATHEFVCDLSVPMHLGNSVTSCAISPDGRYAVANGSDHGIVIVDVEENLLLRSIRVPSASLRFSADGKLLIVGTMDGFVHEYSFPKMERIDKTRLDDNLVVCVDISKDSRFIAATGYDKQIKILDRRHGTIRELSDLPAFSCLVRLSPDGRRILTAGLDGRVRLWDRQTGEQLIHWEIPGNAWPIGEFSSDGSAIVIAGWKTELAIHAPSIEKLRPLSAAALRSQARENVTFASPEER